jgi:hypothetical protein
MNSNNFICHDCEQTFFVAKYRKVYRNDQMVLDRDYQCYHCKSFDTSLLPPPKRNYNEGVCEYGKFSSASDEEKKKILTKRANDHYKTKGKEEKRERFKVAMNKMRGS